MSYKAEQKVNYAGMAMPATIISGPHPTHGADRWLIRKADETVSLVKAAELSPILSRRDMVAKTICEAVSFSRWDSATAMTHARYLRVADHVLAALAANNDTEVAPLAAGDRIRILKTGLEWATVTRGDILTVMSVDGGDFRTNAPHAPLGSQWTFAIKGEGKGWERA
ncbi:hypothetical protein IPZ61_15765 [Streptomyces sioyaensis]|uniref:hypothetical protein n=1 Tax=Streptomyces sioyaensis TaxID=67364 RepID=UPI001F45B915|nr:hypothetical protein [Streptomyces sioyaensis]MCF3174775.1 hypothetical protein [Streptomyces sioyaensis]